MPGKDRADLFEQIQNHYFYINGKEAVSLDNEEDVEKFFCNAEIFNEQKN